MPFFCTWHFVTFGHLLTSNCCWWLGRSFLIYRKPLDKQTHLSLSGRPTPGSFCSTLIFDMKIKRWICEEEGRWRGGGCSFCCGASCDLGEVTEGEAMHAWSGSLAVSDLISANLLQMLKHLKRCGMCTNGTAMRTSASEFTSSSSSREPASAPLSHV